MPIKKLGRPLMIAVIVIVAASVLFYLFIRVSPTPGPSPVATGSTSCESAQGNEPAFESRVPVAAWILGVREGAYAGWMKQIANGDNASGASGMQDWIALSRKQAETASASAERMAATLQVQRPAAFVAPVGREAFDAFQTWVEAPNQPTARGLANAYAPWVCHLYKLGTYWGYSMLYRAAARDQANVYDGELRHYAVLVSLPQNLLDRMTSRADAGLNDGQVVAESEEISRAVAEYWAERKGGSPAPR